MFFSSLALMFGAMTFTINNATIPNSSFDSQSLYGGKVLSKHILIEDLDITEFSDEHTFFSCDLTGQTSRFDTDTQSYITTTETYHDFFYIKGSYLTGNDGDLFTLNCFSRLSTYVAPSFYFQLDIDYGYNSDTVFCDTISSIDESLLLSYDSDPNYYASNYINLDITLYFVKTIDHDPISDLTSDFYTGYENGYADGKNEGQQIAYDMGYSHGLSDGYQNGYQTGHQVGYNEGLSAGQSGGGAFSFTNLFASVADTPILMVRRLFGFEIFGMTAISILMSFFTAIVVIHIMRKVW